MAHLNEKAALQDAIRLLKMQQAEELNLLKEQLQLSYESIKPSNIIKTALQEVVSSAEVKNTLFQHLQTWGAEYLSRKIFAGKHPGMMRKIVATAIGWGVSNWINKRTERQQS